MIRELADISAELKAGRPVPSITIRTFIRWFDAKRRGYFVVQRIREQLSEAGLSTFPDFEEETWIDAPIGFVLLEKEPIESQKSSAQGDRSGVEKLEEGQAEPQEAILSAGNDPIYRVSRLQAANQTIISVKPDSTVYQVVTTMMAGSISQLPVMTNERDVKGMITWRTIAIRVALGSGGECARDFIEPHHEVRHNSSIFEAIPIIVSNDYVLVRSIENKISGIVTSSDLSSQFRNMTEPFLLLSEIENLVRNMISGKFTLSELRHACDPVGNRDLKEVSDLTFGDYVHFLQIPVNWSKISQKVDRLIFCEKLDLTREIRNDVMHFRPEGINREDLESLRNFTAFLKDLDIILR